MVGLHLRQADFVVASDCVPPPEGNPADYYLPVEETRELLRMVRVLTDVPVVIGGFGFTVHAMKTAKTLEVDFGVQGEPDGFFEHFEGVLARRELAKVPNLIYRQGSGYRANPRVFYPPPPFGEYDENLIAELIRFYRDRPLSAGFEPGWNDAPSLEDRNLARCRVPFRVTEALSYYRNYLDWADAQSVSPDNRQTFYLFLGNAFSDAQTIRKTLRNVERYGLQARHEQASVGPATRVFEIDGKLNCGDSGAPTSLGRTGKVRFDVVSPTYYYPPKLVEHLGSEQAVREFLDYVASTFLSTAYEQDRHWSTFLGESISQEGLLLLMREAKSAKSVKAVPVDTGEDARMGFLIQRTLRQIWAKPDERVVRPLFFPGAEHDLYDYVVQAVLTQLLRPHARAFKPVLRFLQIPHDVKGFHSLSPYGLARILYRRYDSNDELIQDVCKVHGIGPDTIDRLALQFLLRQCNVRIRPEYRELLFGRAGGSRLTDR